MRFRILGPLDVSAGETTVEFTSGRQRIILVMLLLREGRLVSLDRLIDALWSTEPPATAKGQIQTCISALRRQLRELGDGHMIATSAVGYTIRVPAESLDAAMFARVVSRGRALAADGKAADAVTEFRAALALWRGPAAVNVECAVVRAMAIRLDEERVRVIEECIELELTLGRHREVVAELSELVKSYPLRELLRAQHMLALYRSARQADAIESFQAIRSILMEDLGLEPGEKLCALHGAILAQDSSLMPAAHVGLASTSTGQVGALVPRQLPAAVADFTGREEMVNQVVAALSVANPANRQRYLPVVCLTGQGGVGKTALALHVAHAVRHHYHEGQIFVALQDADGQRSDPLELMARLLGSLGLPAAALPDRMQDRMTIYRSWLGERKILVVLDDVDNVSSIMALIPGNPHCGVIITSRYPLTSLPGAQHFNVESLDEAACIELLGKVIGTSRVAAEAEMALELVTLCECLPLAVRIVAAKLASRPHWSIQQMVRRITDETRRLDELALPGMGIRATIATSYLGLSRIAQQLFIRLGLIGAVSFASWAIAPLLDADIDSAADALDELVAARLVEVRVDEAGGCRFQLHDLIRIFALERLSVDETADDRAAALRRLLSCWLSLADDAHCRLYGDRYGVHSHADLWTLPGQVRDQLLENPLAWFRQERAGLVLAVTQATQVGLDEVCWGLAVTSVTLFESDYRIEDWRRTHELALDAVRKACNVRGEAALLCSLGTMALSSRIKDAPAYLESALDIFRRLGDTPGCAWAVGALAFADRLTGRLDQALLGYEQALIGYRMEGDQVGEADALANMAQIYMDRGAYDDAELLLDEAAGRGAQALRITAQIEHRRGDLYLRTNHWWRAEQSYMKVLGLVRECGDMVGEAYALAGLGAVRTRQGQFEFARADLSAALTLSRQMGSNLAHGRVLLSFADFCVTIGEWDRAIALISEGLMIFNETGPAPALRARLLELKACVDEHAGNPTAADAARREAMDLARDTDSRQICGSGAPGS